jgi:cell division protein FtsI (penicillin-binding protein 3)
MKARNVIADPSQITRQAHYADLLAPIVKVSKKELIRRLTGTNRFSYVAKKITMSQWKKIQNLDLVGISSEGTTLRVYPGGALAANLLGYVGDEGHGLSGLESALDKTLTGTDGTTTIEQVKGHEIPTSERHTVEAVNGSSVRLTIDADLQGVAEQALAQQVKSANAKSGEVVIMDPATGNILAMANYPTFDPNHPQKTKAVTKQNRAVSDAFEPGSTGKVMTMAAVINEGVLNPKSRIVVPSGLPRGGTTFHDDIPHGVWHLTLAGVLAKSSNMGSILAAEKIGQEKLHSYMQDFGIGQLSGLHFPGETGGSLPNPKDPNQWSGTTFPTLAFGQGYSVSALQMASVYATLANGGVRRDPRLIAGTMDANNNFEAAPMPAGKRVVSAKAAKSVRLMMEKVVSPDGTAPGAAITGYRVGGKTGTANRFDSSVGGYSGYTASFIGVVPIDKPSLVTAVIIHGPRGAHFGSLVSAPVFKKVTTYALAHLRIPPTPLKQSHLPVKW